MVTVQSARRILQKLKRTTVTVVGDIMLDRYLWGEVERISPEAPVPVVMVERMDLRPGGAANVAWNVSSLGAKVNLIGVLGRDNSARELKELIINKGIPTDDIVTDSSRVTTEKMRIIARNQQVVRTDFESNDRLSQRTISKIVSKLRRCIPRSRVVVVSDYGKGVVIGEVMDEIRSLCKRHGVPFFIDPKEGHFSLYREAFVLTPNKKEAGGFYNIKIRNEDDLKKVGRSLLDDLDAHAVLITRGEEGMTLFEKRRREKHFPTRAREVFDVTGAGDTVIGVLAVVYASGASLYEAIEISNISAGIVIREVGTAAVSPKEVLAELK